MLTIAPFMPLGEFPACKVHDVMAVVGEMITPMFCASQLTSRAWVSAVTRQRAVGLRVKVAELKFSSAKGHSPGFSRWPQYHHRGPLMWK